MTHCDQCGAEATREFYVWYALPWAPEANGWYPMAACDAEDCVAALEEDVHP